jgi:hypothetical protein
MTKGNPMTNNPTRQELEKLKEAKKIEIKQTESKLKNLKSELSEIKRQIFKLINAEFSTTHSPSPIKPIDERKFK